MASSKKFIPALGYEWLTWLYDLMIKVTMPEKRFRSELINQLKPKTDQVILEFGYGTGSNLLIAHKSSPGTQFIGLDIDEKVRRLALQKLRKNNITLDLDLYDGETFPYQDKSFDKVYSCLVFHQLDPATKSYCLNEINRVLKPGGELIIADWGKAKSKLMRTTFYTVQLLDGFETTTDNVEGLLPDYMVQAGFIKVLESGHINTVIGTFSYYQGNKEG